MPIINKSPLNFDQYEKYGISQQYSAFTIEVDDIEIAEADDFEYEYAQKGYKIFKSSLENKTEGRFKLILIVAKLEYTF